MLLRGNWRFMEANFGEGPLDTKVDLPQERREFQEFQVAGDRLSWTLVRGPGRIRFDGTRGGDVIRGVAEQNGVRGEFQLVRISRPPASDSNLAGTFRTDRGDLVTVARFDFGDDVDRLALIDAREGYWGALLPAGADRYLFAPARSGRFPTDIRVEFRRNSAGAASDLTLVDTGARRVAAKRIAAYETRDVSFRNGEVTLAGTVLHPTTPGRHPAVVMLHSSGNQSRNGPVAYFRLIANLLAANGFTVLVYDKRGVGDSTGAWVTASFDDLAGDASAAVAALRQEPGVDPSRVGLWRLSQGGWIAPLVAAEDAKVRFLALVSAAATTPAQQEIDRVALVMKANGSTPRDIEGAERYLRVFFDVVSGRQPWEALQSAMESTAGEPWIQYVQRPRTARELGWSPAPATLDPALAFLSITVPVLALHGSEDTDIRATTNSPLFAKLSRHTASRQRVLVGADHYMLLGVDSPDRQYRRLSPDYLRTMIDWLKRASRQ